MAGVQDAVVFDHAAVQVGGRTIWSDVSLRVAQGEFLAVLGPNGVGKSTLVKAALGHTVSVIGQVKQGITERRGGKQARNIAKVAAARRLLTLVFYGLRDGQIRCLSSSPEQPPENHPAGPAHE